MGVGLDVVTIEGGLLVWQARQSAEYCGGWVGPGSVSVDHDIFTLMEVGHLHEVNIWLGHDTIQFDLFAFAEDLYVADLLALVFDCSDDLTLLLFLWRGCWA